MYVDLKRLIFVCLILLIPVLSRAQGTAARQGKLQITVLDPSNAVVQEATVTVVGLESSTQAATIPTVKTGDKAAITAAYTAAADACNACHTKFRKEE